MIFAEGVLVGAWMLVWGSVFFFLQIMLRHRAASTSLGLITA